MSLPLRSVTHSPQGRYSRRWGLMPFDKGASGSPRPSDLPKKLGKEVAEVQSSLLVISNLHAPSLCLFYQDLSPHPTGDFSLTLSSLNLSSLEYQHSLPTSLVRIRGLGYLNPFAKQKLAVLRQTHFTFQRDWRPLLPLLPPALWKRVSCC